MMHWFVKMLAGAPAIPIPRHPIPCVMGCEDSVGIFYLSKGCICRKDQVQALCAQHAVSSEPIENFEIISRWQ